MRTVNTELEAYIDKTFDSDLKYDVPFSPEEEAAQQSWEEAWDLITRIEEALSRHSLEYRQMVVARLAWDQQTDPCNVHRDLNKYEIVIGHFQNVAHRENVPFRSFFFKS